jgi:hypothetical protein
MLISLLACEVFGYVLKFVSLVVCFASAGCDAPFIAFIGWRKRRTVGACWR